MVALDAFQGFAGAVQELSSSVEDQLYVADGKWDTIGVDSCTELVAVVVVFDLVQLQLLP